MTSQFHPLVTVVIPTYNRAPCIGRSIQSVLSQSYQNFDLIVVDDGSTDETTEVVAAFRDKRISYIRLPKNAGAGAARNAGIHQSKAPFLAFQDSDDEWLPGKLAKQMAMFDQESHRLGVVYSNMLRVSKNAIVMNHESPDIVPGRLVNPTTKYYQAYGLGIQSTVIKRECLAAVGYFNEELTAFEDLELFNRLSKRYDFCHIPEPLVKYYEMEGLSKDLYANWLARKRLLNLYWKELLTQNTSFLINELRWLRRTRRNAMKRKRKLPK